MSPAVMLILILLAFCLIIVFWTMALRYQRARKISEIKVAYLRLASQEESAYQRYLTVEKRAQQLELELDKSRESIAELRSKLRSRRGELRELIGRLRIVRSRLALVGPEEGTLDDEIEETKLLAEVRTRLILSQEDKRRIAGDRLRVAERLRELPEVAQESEKNSKAWDQLRRELEAMETEFRKLDEEAFRKFAEAYVQKRTEDKRLDPERDLVNLILLLNNKRGLLYVRRKEAAKDPTTDSQEQIKKHEADIRKLEGQLVTKSRNYGISVERLEELRNLFLK